MTTTSAPNESPPVVLAIAGSDSGGGAGLPLLSAGSGVAFAVAAWSVAGANPPRGFALVGAAVSAGALAIAGIVAVYG